MKKPLFFTNFALSARADNLNRVVITSNECHTVIESLVKGVKAPQTAVKRVSESIIASGHLNPEIQKAFDIIKNERYATFLQITKKGMEICVNQIQPGETKIYIHIQHKEGKEAEPKNRNEQQNQKTDKYRRKVNIMRKTRVYTSFEDYKANKAGEDYNSINRIMAIVQTSKDNMPVLRFNACITDAKKTQTAVSRVRVALQRDLPLFYSGVKEVFAIISKEEYTDYLKIVSKNTLIQIAKDERGYICINVVNTITPEAETANYKIERR